MARNPKARPTFSAIKVELHHMRCELEHGPLQTVSEVSPRQARLLGQQQRERPPPQQQQEQPPQQARVVEMGHQQLLQQMEIVDMGHPQPPQQVYLQGLHGVEVPHGQLMQQMPFGASGLP